MNGMVNELRATVFKHAPCVDTDIDMVPETLNTARPALTLCSYCARTTECRDDLKTALAAAPTTFGVWAGVYIPSARNAQRAGEPSRTTALETLGIERHTPTTNGGGTGVDEEPCKYGHPATARYRDRKGWLRCRTCINTRKRRARQHPTTTATLIGATA